MLRDREDACSKHEPDYGPARAWCMSALEPTASAGTGAAAVCNNLCAM